MRRLIVFFGIAFGLCAIWATAASADTSGNANTDEKWVVSIVRVLHDEPKRPFQMKVAIKGIQPKVLRQTLRALEADGLVDQILMPDGLGGRCIAWQLTERGRSLVTPMAALYRWGRDNLPVGVQAAIDGAAGPRGSLGNHGAPK